MAGRLPPVLVLSVDTTLASNHRPRSCRGSTELDTWSVPEVTHGEVELEPTDK